MKINLYKKGSGFMKKWIVSICFFLLLSGCIKNNENRSTISEFSGKQDISNIEKVDCNLGNGMVYKLTDSQHIIDIYNRLMKI